MMKSTIKEDINDNIESQLNYKYLNGNQVYNNTNTFTNNSNKSTNEIIKKQVQLKTTPVIE